MLRGCAVLCVLQDVRCYDAWVSLAGLYSVICAFDTEWFRGVYERLVGCVRQAAFELWVVPSNGLTWCIYQFAGFLRIGFCGLLCGSG